MVAPSSTAGSVLRSFHTCRCPQATASHKQSIENSYITVQNQFRNQLYYNSPPSIPPILRPSDPLPCTKSIPNSMASTNQQTSKRKAINETYEDAYRNGEGFGSLKLRKILSTAASCEVPVNFADTIWYNYAYYDRSWYVMD